MFFSKIYCHLTTECTKWKISKAQFTGLPSLPSHPTCSPQHTRVPPEPRTSRSPTLQLNRLRASKVCLQLFQYLSMPRNANDFICKTFLTSVLTWCRKGPMSHAGGSSEVAPGLAVSREHDPADVLHRISSAEDSFKSTNLAGVSCHFKSSS